MTKRQAYWVMTPRRAYSVLVAITLAVYGAMAIWTLPGITTAAGGLVPFDLRFGGYSTDEARAFLGALNLQGRVLYVGPQYVLDMFYPALLAIVLIGAILRLIRFTPLRWALIAAVLIGMGADYTENTLVTALLKDPNPASDAAVLMASRATQIKSAMTGVAILSVVVAYVGTWIKNRRSA
jgi:hypothetical protein